MIPVIGPLTADERAEWESLARAYKEFYRTDLADSAYDETWRRLMADNDVHGLGARVNGRLVGITHFLYHTGTWSLRACYLEDLFVDSSSRGQGVARALVEAVARQATQRGARRLYWLTHETNATARLLYDRIARCSGFVEYEYPIAS